MFKYSHAVVTAALFAVSALGSQAYAQLNSKPTQSNPVMNGVVKPGEWNAAGSLPDGFGLAGSTYAMWQTGLNYQTWSYNGNFSFLLHNIEQNTTFGNGPTGQDPAYNVFDIYTPQDPINKYLEVTVFYDGFSVSKFNATGGIVGTRSFKYGVDLAPEQTASYDWDNYWGVYARGGYGNSAFTSGLDGAIDNDNQLFEVAFRTTDAFGSVRRAFKDPDQKRNWGLVLFNDVVVDTIPEPETYALFIVGLGVLSFAARRRDRRFAAKVMTA